MPAKRIPSYRLHRSSGQARVIINGQHVYLGQYGSPESREKYARAIAEHFSGQSSDPVPALDGFPSLSIDELLLRYWEFAKAYYVKDGKPTKELTCMKEAMGHIRILYSSDPAREMGPKKLKAIQQHMIQVCRLSRGVINNRINRIKRIFKWAVSEELVPPSVHEGLRSVRGLAYGRSEARETEPVKPVLDTWVDAILPNVAPQIAAIIELQRLTGMRPEEVTGMRPCDIDTASAIWVYTPFDHKQRWRGHERRIPLGPRAQRIIENFLNRRADEYLFSPQEAEAWRSEQRRQKRKTPMTPSQSARQRSKSPQRPKRDHYDTDSYRRAVEYGIKKTNREREKDGFKLPEVPHWFPYQLRHAYGARVRKEFGFESAAVGLGHARTNVTEIYAEQDFGRAVEVAKKVG